MLCSSRFCLPPVFFGYQNVLIDISNASYRIGSNNLDIVQDIGYDRFFDLETTASSMWERTARIQTRRLLLAKMNRTSVFCFPLEQ